MGFLEDLFEMILNTPYEIQKNVEIYRTYSTERLIREARETSRPTQRAAILKVLKERGVIKSQ